MTRTRALRPALLLSTALAAGLMAAAPASAQTEIPGNTLPDLQGGVPSGVTIGTSGPAGSPTLNIGLTDTSHILNWNSFNIGQNATVQFCPSGCATTSAVLNRINDSDPTLIFGDLNAPSNLTVFLINTNGIVFGNGSSVNVGGLVASAATITNANFNAGVGSGNYIFTGANAPIAVGSGANITTTGGPLVLIGASTSINFNPPGDGNDNIINFNGINGTLSASGDVAIALAEDVTVSMAPGSPLSLTIAAGTSFNNAVVVGGTVSGRNVYLAYATQGNFTNALLSVSGAITATGAAATDRGVVLVAGNNTSADLTDSGITILENNNTDGTAAVELNGAEIQTTFPAMVTSGGASVTVRAADGIQLTGDTTVTAAKDGSVNFRSAISGSGTLESSTSGSGQTTFAANLTNVGGLAVTGPTRFGGTSMTSSGDVTLGSVLLTNAGNVTITAGGDPTEKLTIASIERQSAGDITLGGRVTNLGNAANFIDNLTINGASVLSGSITVANKAQFANNARISGSVSVDAPEVVFGSIIGSTATTDNLAVIATTSASFGQVGASGAGESLEGLGVRSPSVTFSSSNNHLRRLGLDFSTAGSAQDVSFTNNGDLTIGAVGGIGGPDGLINYDDVTLTATGGTLDVATLSTAGNIDLTATTIGATGHDLSLTSTGGSITLTGSAVGRDIALFAGDAVLGDIKTGAMTAADDIVVRSARHSDLGNLSSGNGADTPGTAAGDALAGATLSGGDISVVAGGNVIVGTTVSTGNTSDVFLQAGTIIPLSTVSGQGANLNVTAGGALTISGSILETNINLSALTGDLTVDRFNVTNATLLAGTNIVVTDTTVPSTSSISGNGSFTADDFQGIDPFTITPGGGNLTIVDTLGGYFLGPVTRAGSLTVQTINGGLTVTGAVESTAGSVTLNSGADLSIDNSVSGAQNVSLLASGLLDVNASVTATAGDMLLSAGGNLQVDSGLAAGAGLTLNSGGSTFISSLAGITAGSIGGSAGTTFTSAIDLTAGTGSVNLSSAGDLNVQAVTADDNLTLASNGGVLIANGALQATTGSASVTGAQGVSISTLSAATNATVSSTLSSINASSVSAGSGFATLNGAGGVTVGTVTAGTNANVISGLGGINAGTVTATNGSALVDGRDNVSVGTVFGENDVTLNSTLGTLTATGNVRADTGTADLSSRGDLSVASVYGNQNAYIVSELGAVSLNGAVTGNLSVVVASGTTLTSSSAAPIWSLNDVVIDAGTTLNLNGTVTSGSGSVGIESGQGATIGAAVDADDDVDIHSGGSLLVNAAVTAGRSVGMTSFTGMTINGAVTGGANRVGGQAREAVLLSANGLLDVNAPIEALTGDASLMTTGVAISIDGTVTAPGTLKLQAGALISQTAAISAGTLTGGAGSALLTNAGNSVGTLGAFNADTLSLADTGGLIVSGPVRGSNGTGAATSVTLNLPGALTLAGTPGTPTIIAGTLDIRNASSVSQAANQRITVGTLTGFNVGDTSLLGASNAIQSVQNWTAASGGDFLLDNNTGNISLINMNANSIDVLNQGSIGASNLTAGYIGLFAGGGISADFLSAGFIELVAANSISASNLSAIDIEMDAGWNIDLTGPIDAYGIDLLSGRVGSLSLTAGNDISQSASGVITTKTLNVDAGGAIDLDNATNDIIELGLVSGQSFAFRNQGGLIISDDLSADDGVTIVTGGNLIVEADISTTNSNINLDAGTSAISLNAGVNAGTATVDLKGASVSQGGAGVITAGLLTGTFSGTAILGGANMITALGDFTAGQLELNNAMSLDIRGLVTSTGAGTANPGISISAEGITQFAPNDSIVDGGVQSVRLNGQGEDIRLEGIVRTSSTAADAIAIVNASGVVLGNMQAAGGTLMLGENLRPITGNTTQFAGTAVNIARLAALAPNTTIRLENAGNEIGALGAITAGSLVLRDDVGGLQIVDNQRISGTLDLRVDNGAVTQTAGTIEAGLLRGNSNGGASFALTNNLIDAFGPWTNVGSGGINLRTDSVGGVEIAGNIAAGTGSLTILARSVDGGDDSFTAGGNISITASAGDNILGTVTAGGNADLFAASTLGVGLVSGSAVNGSGGAVFVGGAGGGTITLTSGSILDLGDGTASGAVTLDAVGDMMVGSVTGSSITGNGGSIDIGSAQATGGALSLTSGSTLNIDSGEATGAITLTAPGALTAGTLNGGSITGNGGSIEIDEATSGSTLTLTSDADLLLGIGEAAGAVTLDAAGDIVIDEITGSTITGTGGSIDIGMAEATVGAMTLTSGSSLNVDEGTSAGAMQLTAAGALTAGSLGGASISGSGGSVNIVGAGAGGALTLTSGSTLVLGTGTAGGAASLTAGTGMTVTSVTGSTVTGQGQSVDIGSATATSGALALTATNGLLRLGTGQAATTATLIKQGASDHLQITNTLNTAGNVVVTSQTGARIGTIRTTGGNIEVNTTSGAMTGVVVDGDGANLRADAAASTVTVNAGLATTGSVTGTEARLGQVDSGTLVVNASNVHLSGPVVARTSATFTNTGAANATTTLGDVTGATGYVISDTEMDRITTPLLNIQSGARAVAIGNLSLAGGTASTRLNLFTTGRMDVTGKFEQPAGVARTVQLGGSAANTGEATVLRVAATAAAGGRLLFEGGTLELRANKIGVGQDQGFLDATGLGLTPDGTPISQDAVSDDFIANSASTLYRARAPYTDAVLIKAGSLRVTYRDYALFQNTSVPGARAGGIMLAGTIRPMLQLNSSGVNGNNAFAMFAEIDGRGGLEAAVLPRTFVELNNVNLGNTRINGCLAGSGAGGCIVTTVAQPLINVFDAGRAEVLNAAGELPIAFDPIVGANNEALFAGLSAIEDIATDSPECKPEDGKTCPAPEGNK